MTPLLQNISDGLNKKLLEIGAHHRYDEDVEIFAEGDPAAFLPVVMSGSVKMTHFLEPGKEVIINIFKKGEMFAVPPVFDGMNYPATAIAMEITRLLLIDRPSFLQLLRDSHEFSFAVISWMCEMLREKTSTIQNLATASPEHRVGNVLLKLAEKDAGDGAVTISLRRQDIARIAGLTTETTIRVIRRLAEKDLIRIVHGKVVIEAIEPLRDHLA